MKQLLLRVVSVACVVIFMAGCEWDTVDDSQAWNDSGYSWVNFNGVYRASGGGVVVANWTRTPGAEPDETAVNNESIGTGVATQTFYGGVLANRPVVIGSITILAGGYGFTDNGDGTLAGTLGRTGTINYGTGAWSIDLQGTTISAGADIVASYLYTTGGTDGEIEPGSSGLPIYTLTIQQTGNNLVIIDSNGNSFTGKLGVMSRTSSSDPDVFDGMVVGQFEVTGQAYGQNIRIVGTLQGTLAGNANVFELRQIQATWIESGGTTGDILGISGEVTVDTTGTETTNI